MKTFNGFEYYTKGDTCPHCAAKQKGDPDDDGTMGYPKDFGGYFLECPECYRIGCDECMPCGRGCICPECEEL